MVFSDTIATTAFFDYLQKEYQTTSTSTSPERQDFKLTTAYVRKFARRPLLSEIRIKEYIDDTVIFEFKGLPGQRQQGALYPETHRVYLEADPPHSTSLFQPHPALRFTG